jgi:hypothetical protein
MHMYIAHYKSVNSKNEFYAKGRETLDYPTQVQHNKERYMLYTTYTIPGKTQLKNLKDRLKTLGIPSDVDVDIK